MEEGLSNVIRLPEDCPSAIENLLGYLYLGDSILEKFSLQAEGDRSDDDPKSAWRSIFRLYQVAEKYAFEELQNLVMDFFYAWARDQNSPNLKKLQRIESELPRSSRMARFWAAELAWELRSTEVDDDEVEKEFREEFFGWPERGSTFATDVFKLSASVDEPDIPTKKDCCTWHVHKYTAKCRGEDSRNTDDGLGETAAHT